MFGSLCFFEFLFVYSGSGFVTCQDPMLLFDDSFHNFFRFIPSWELHFIPCQTQITVLSSPTEQTLLSAVEQSRSHLYALVGFDSIEFLFVAWSAFD